MPPSLVFYKTHAITKNLIIAIALFTTTHCFGQLPSTNITLFVSMEWSTNGTDWNVNWNSNDIEPMAADFCTNGAFLFRASPGILEDLTDGYQMVNVGTYWGHSAAPDSITNLLFFRELFVRPSMADGFTNLIYRPVLEIRDMRQYAVDTNDDAGTINTNSPPLP